MLWSFLEPIFYRGCSLKRYGRCGIKRPASCLAKLKLIYTTHTYRHSNWGAHIKPMKTKALS